MFVPRRVRNRLERSSSGRAWLEELPDVIGELADRWALDVGTPFDDEDVSEGWVAVVRRKDGTAAVLKISFPDMESEHEIRGLRFWDGDPTVLLLEADEDRKAMLLERCVPGTRLRSLPEDEQDVVLAPLIRRLWRAPPDDLPFRPLTSMVEAWIDEVMARRERWPDDRIVHDGLAAFRELAAEPTERVVLGTDVHAGNVLRAERHPWLLIDPKPFVGDPAYDATQHLLNCDGRMHEDPTGTIARFADLLGVDPERARRWTFARTAIEASSDPTRWLDVAIRLAT